MRQPGVVIVGSPADSLTGAVATALQAQGIWTDQIVPNALGDSLIEVHDDWLELNNLRIGGILFRALPDATFSEDFVAKDSAFSDAEVRACWLAASHLPTVLTINRYDATAWFEGLRWTVWRRAFVQAGIPISNFTFGDTKTEGELAWYPYSSTVNEAAPSRETRQLLGAALSASLPQHVSLAVCGQVLSREPNAVSLQAATLLNKLGVRLAEIATDQFGRTLWINPQPIITKPEDLQWTANLLAAQYYEHIHRW